MSMYDPCIDCPNRKHSIMSELVFTTTNTTGESKIIVLKKLAQELLDELETMRMDESPMETELEIRAKQILSEV